MTKTWCALSLFLLCSIAAGPALGQTVADIIPATAPRGATVVITGSSLDSGGPLTVRFSSAAGTIEGTIRTRTSTVTEVVIPPAAISGSVRVENTGGVLATLPFTVAENVPFAIVNTLVSSAAGREPLKRPTGVELLPDGTVLVADTMHHRIATVARDGTTIGYSGTHPAGFVDGPLATAEFRNPQALAWDSSRSVLYVADTGNHAIRRIANGQVTTVAGTGSRGDRDGAGVLSELTLPSALAVASDGTVYIADTGNHKIKAILLSGDVVTIAGTGRAGALDGLVAEFRSPEGVAVDTRGIWVADSGNNLIRLVAGGVTSTIAGSSRGGYADGPLTAALFNNPTDIDLDPFGSLLVSDTGNGVIRSVDVTANVVSTLVGRPGHDMADGPAASALFRNPAATVRAADGHLVIGDSGNDAVRLAYLQLAATDVYPQLSPLNGTTIRIFGSGFVDGATTVLIGTQAVQATVVDGSMLVVNAPAVSVTQVVDVTVTTPAGISTLSGALTYAGRPSISDVAPTAGAAGGGDRVTLTGSNFIAGQTIVLFGGTEATIVSLTATSVVVDTPPHTPGTVDVQIQTPSGTATRASAYTFIAAPAISSFSPPAGDAGTLVTIIGNNFALTPSANLVSFGGLPAEILSATETQLIVRVPTGAVTGPITVSTDGGTAISPTNFVIPVYTEIWIEPASVTLNISEVRQMTAKVRSSDGSVRDLTALVTWATGDATIASVTPAGKVQALRVGLTNVTARLGELTASATVQVTAIEVPPPDPTATAPPTDPTRPTIFTESIEFLYDGPNATQRGVSPGAIVTRRVSVVRGRVADAAGAPLPAVRVSVHGAPEVGYTLSRTDGAFDLVVNGGGIVTLALAKDGYIPVHRATPSSWNDMFVVDEVRMIPYDATVTTIRLPELAANAVAQGSVTNDESGTRRATMVFQPGTSASMRFADGTAQPLSELHVRATEQTVGTIGAMPGELPLASAYTYCVELSADEAVTAGATSIEFTKPVFVYVENFLGFPAGGRVPAGYYDRERAQWIASDDGRVVNVLSVSDGLAMIDTDGDGTADDGAAIGVTDSERRTIGSLYSPGQSIWRVGVTHFTPWDFNWGWGLPNGALPPDLGAPYGEMPLWDENCQNGSIIECESLSLGQSIPLSGTPFTLEYRSRNMPGYRPKTEITATLSGATVPTPLKRIDVDITIAGKIERRSFSASANQKQTFSWDGMDVYGRRLYTDRSAKISIHYIYDAVFGAPAGQDRSFGATGELTLGVNTRREIPLSQHFLVPLRGPRPDQGLGGWTLSAQHAYDPTARMLRLGSGADVALDARGLELKAVQSLSANGIATGPDGSIYTFANARPSSVRHITPDGFVFTIAGGGSTPPADGVPALGTYIGTDNVGVLANGDVVFLEGFTNTLYRIDDQGILRKLASAQNIGPIAIAPSGVYYIAGKNLMHVDAAGNSTVINRGTNLKYVTNIAVSPLSGAPYVVIREDEAEHPYRTFQRLYQGTSESETILYSWNGGAGPIFMAIDGSGRVVFTMERYLGYIKDGEIRPYPLAVPIGTPTYFAFFPNGEIVWYDASNDKVCPFVNGRFSCIVAGTYPVAILSGTGGFHAVLPNGTLGLTFDARGRHIETRDPRLGTVVTRLFYGSSTGFVTRIEDANGLATTVERDAAGTPVAIVAPNGDRTELVLGTDGRVEEILAPGNVTHAFTYDSSGLMRSHTNPRGKTSNYEYDSFGRLKKALDAGEGSKPLALSESGHLDTVTVTTAEGRVWKYETTRSDLTSVDRTVTDPRGLKFRTVTSPTSVISLAPDGMRADTAVVPDVIWKTLTPFAVSSQLRFPSGRSLTVTNTRTVSGASSTDPYAFSSVTETSSVNGLTMRTTFDRASRKITTTSPLNRALERFLDDKGRLREVRWPGDAPMNVQYDARGRMLSMSQGDRAYQFTWSELDLLATMSDPAGKTTSFTYDDAGRVTSQVLPDLRVISFGYDADGNLTSLTPPSRPAHIFTFNDVGVMTGATAPGALTTQYVYNRDRELTQVIRPDGSSLGFTYDRGRLQQVASGGRTLGISYSSAGHLQSITDSRGPSLTLGHDGSLPTQVTWAGEISGSVTWSYDASLRVSTESVNGSAVQFGYDNDSLLTAAGAQTIARDATTGRISGTTISAVTDAYTYNAFGETASYAASLNGVEVFAINYVRDRKGRITSKLERRFGFTSGEVYEYDDSGRLTRVRDANGNLITEYSYDVNGNRLSMLRSGTLVEGTYDDTDRVLTYGAASYTHTAAGDLVTRTDVSGTTTYEYDTFGNLRSVSRPGAPVIDYVIDGADRRVGKKVGGTLVKRWLYADGLRVIAELDSGGAMSRFVYATRSNVPDTMTRGSVRYRFLTDQLGSVRYVLDAATGDIAQSLNYDEFGRVVFDSNPGFQPFGFAGGLYDPDTELVRFGARDYDPHTGRWTAKDPIGFDGGDTNLYAYTMNDPVNLIDPSGLLFGGTIDAGEAYGEAALGTYADILTDPDAAWYEKAGAAVGGFFSALWTPCTSDSTFAVLSTAAGGAGGLRAAGSKAAGREFSHWIPDRVLKRTGSKFLRNTFGTSRANGNYVTSMRHYLHDPHRMLRGTTRAGKFPPLLQQLDRGPRVYYGTGAGAAVGGAAVGSGGGCGCS